MTYDSTAMMSWPNDLLPTINSYRRNQSSLLRGMDQPLHRSWTLLSGHRPPGQVEAPDE